MRFKRTPFFSQQYWIRSGEVECDLQPTHSPRRFKCSRCGWKSPVIAYPGSTKPFPASKLHHICKIQSGYPIRRKPIGLGDSIAFWIHVLSLGFVSACSSCKKRRSLLNTTIPYGRDLRWWRNRAKKWMRPMHPKDQADDGKAG